MSLNVRSRILDSKKKPAFRPACTDVERRRGIVFLCVTGRLGVGGLGSSLLTSKVITCMRGKGSGPTKKVQKKFQIMPNSPGKAPEASAKSVETGWRRGLFIPSGTGRVDFATQPP